MNRIWLAGLLRQRYLRLGGVALGVATAVALIACLGAFLTASRQTMTARATRDVAVSWQVQLQPGTAPAPVIAAVRAGGATTAQTVGFAATPAMSTTTAGSTQTTGAGVVVGLPAGYDRTFPGVLRLLTGSASGVLLAQQTAANLHASVGSVVTISRTLATAATVRVTGIVDLPQADSLFQHVGSTAPLSAPPDNVVLLDAATFASVFPPGPVSAGSAVRMQVHATWTRPLSQDPAVAYEQVTAAAHNVEAKLNGAVTVGDNLASVLGAARQDAAYAQILFLFLGVPGAVLAAGVTAAVAGSGAARRRREQSLLRTRGVGVQRLVRLAAVEALIVGAVGGAAGIALAVGVGPVPAGGRLAVLHGTALAWAGVAVLLGLIVAGASIIVPAARDARALTVMAGRTRVPSDRDPWWMRVWVDVVLIAVSLVVFRAAGANGYSLVLAPEGVAQISVSYWAFLAPTLLWIGGLMVLWRLAILGLRHGRPILRRLARPAAGRMAGATAASLSHNRRPLARSIVLLAAALSFAASTAVFNATYQQQAEADAQLTNGADVTVTLAPGTVRGPGYAGALAAVPGVRHVQALQHRLAYVGNDLQDLYGIDPATITTATTLRNAYFQGAGAQASLESLAHNPDGVLVSAETVKDFQLSRGDTLNLRLQDGRTKAYRTVAFRYVGIVNEFPTAPRDSFFVANAAWITSHTGSASVGSFLVDTGGAGQSTVAAALRRRLGTTASVRDISAVRGQVGSSLTSVDLRGLTRVELAFAVVLGLAAGGLLLALGIAERRRAHSLAALLGATRSQVRGMVLTEALVVGAGALLGGTLLGWALSAMVVKVLTGVFDPPPDALAIPVAYLTGTAAAVAGALVIASLLTLSRAGRPPVEDLREL